MERQVRLWYSSPIGELLAVILPALPSGLGVGYASGNYLASLVTSLAISGTTYALFTLDLAFIHPRYRALPPNRAVIMEYLTGVLEFTLGTWLAVSLCNLVFGHPFEGSLAWWLVGGTVVTITIFHTLSYTFTSHTDMKRKMAEEERLRAMATEAELKALKAQINPHFLFNTLNTIAALIHSDPAQAETTVERLADMFRYVLAGSERGSVPLREELAFVDDYLRIEQVRFGQRLRFTRQVAPGLLDVPIPSLILQPLVENAVRHGQGHDGSVDLTLQIELDSDHVVITIADQGPGMSLPQATDQPSGHGLRNVNERLQKTYGQANGLLITPNTPTGTRVRLRIPVGGGS